LPLRASHHVQPGGRSSAALAAALIVVAVISADVILSDNVVLVGLLITAPLVCGLAGTATATRVAGATVVSIAALAFLWNDNITSWSYWVPLTVASLGSGAALVMAAYRSRLQRDAVRMRVLADVSQIAHGRLGVEETAQAVADVLVPAVADLCLVDAVDADGTVRRFVGAYNGDPDLLTAFLARSPSPPDATSSAARTVAPKQMHHQALIDDAQRRQLAHDDADYELLKRMATDSAVLVPLVARDRTIGVLTIATRPPRDRLDRDAAAYVETLSGRVALALDNAGLSAELSSTERRLEAILEAVDAAIMVRDVQGRLVYANDAAAELLRVEDPAELLAIPSAELMARFEVFSEDGTAVDLEALPGTRVLRGEDDPPPIIVRNIVRATGEERWLLNKATPLIGADGLRMAVNLIEDITETKRAELAQRLLAEAAREASGAIGVGEVLQAVADTAVRGFADWAWADLADASGKVTTVALAHRDPALAKLGRRISRTWPVDANDAEGAPAVIRTGEPELVEAITDETLARRARDDEHLAALREAGMRSAMVVPLGTAPDVLGALTFVSSTSRRFDPRDLELAGDLGRQAGIAARNAQLNGERAQIAHTLQAGLLPDLLPTVDGWDLSGIYRAAGRLNEVGGDFYDVVRCGDGWAVIIGDVVGKGAEAASVTALVRHTMATMIEATADPAAGLAMLNRRLRERDERLPTLCTVAVITLGRGDEVGVLSAGHPLPLLRRGGRVTAIGSTSPMLGVVDVVEATTSSARIRPGDQLLLYTDGVLDALGRDGRFGEQRLIRALERPRRPARRRRRRAGHGVDRRVRHRPAERRHRDHRPVRTGLRRGSRLTARFQVVNERSKTAP
jgi:GAF domain-containing protein